MSMQENLKLDEKNIAAWNAHDVDGFLALLSDDVSWHDVGGPEPYRGKEAIRQYVEGWYSAFPDLKITAKNRVADEDQVAVEVEFTGTNSGPLELVPGAPAIPPTGRRITAKGTYFARFKDGKVVEVHTYPDAAGMMTQLGLMPMPGS